MFTPSKIFTNIAQGPALGSGERACLDPGTFISTNLLREREVEVSRIPRNFRGRRNAVFELEACSVRHALTRPNRRRPDKAVFPGKALSRFLSDSGGTGLSKGLQQPALVPLIYAQTVFLTRQREIHFGSTRFPRSPLARLNPRRPRVLNCVLSSQGRHDRSGTSRLGQLIVRNAPPISQMPLDEEDVRVARILTGGPASPGDPAGAKKLTPTNTAPPSRPAPSQASHIVWSEGKQCQDTNSLSGQGQYSPKRTDNPGWPDYAL